LGIYPEEDEELGRSVGFPFFLNFVMQENREKTRKIHQNFMLVLLQYEKLLELQNKTNHSA
jgi:hypothetical protein